MEDVNGNLIASDSSLVTLTGSATLAGTTSAHAVNGVATFTNLSVTHPSAATLTASDGVLTPATSSSFTISPAAATHLVFAQQPASPMPGHSLGTVTVSVEDAYGNLATTNHSVVTLAVVDGATLGGTTSVAAVGGVATFSGVVITQNGSHTLSATDGNLVTAVSSSFTIAPALTSLVLTSPSTTVDQGATLQFSVSGLDALGLPIALNAVTWSLDASSTGSIDQSGLFTAGTTAANAVVRVTSASVTTTATISVNAAALVITVNAYAQMVSDVSNTGTLHVRSEVDGAASSNLIYTWSIVSQPTVASQPRRVAAGSGSSTQLAALLD